MSSKEKVIPLIISNKYHEFEEQGLIGGGTSLALKFDPESIKKIISLQGKIVKKINKFRKKNIHPRYENNTLSKPFIQNLKKYGYPFIGKLFTPHISLGSFNNMEMIKKIKELCSPQIFSGPSKLTNLSLYKLHIGDKPELIRDFELQQLL